MMLRKGLLLILASAITSFAQSIPDLPSPISNNAVASVKFRGDNLIFSLMGIGSKKNWDAITNEALEFDPATNKWTAIKPVPGTAGRIAASAIGAQGKVFLFGGYDVDSQNKEITVPDAAVYNPLDERWARLADVPTPVDDAVIGVFHDRFIYLVSGWSGTKSVSDVQIYDVDKNRWLKGTPIPGTPVFAHSGTIVGNTIVYINGAMAQQGESGISYVASEECWMGKIDGHHPEEITWSKLANHPGTARFRIAAGGSEKDEKIYFAGGSDNPYSFNGVGYDGTPSEPSTMVFAFNLRDGKWETIAENDKDAVMDNRGLIVTSYGLVSIGGMKKGQQVTNEVRILKKSDAGSSRKRH